MGFDVFHNEEGPGFGSRPGYCDRTYVIISYKVFWVNIVNMMHEIFTDLLGFDGKMKVGTGLHYLHTLGTGFKLILVTSEGVYSPSRFY